MLEVKRTPSPELNQMLCMSANLKEKFGTSAMMGVRTWSYSHTGNQECLFVIYLEKDPAGMPLRREFKDWGECQDAYFHLAWEGEDNV